MPASFPLPPSQREGGRHASQQPAINSAPSPGQAWLLPPRGMGQGRAQPFPARLYHVGVRLGGAWPGTRWWCCQSLLPIPPAWPGKASAISCPQAPGLIPFLHSGTLDFPIWELDPFPYFLPAPVWVLSQLLPCSTAWPVPLGICHDLPQRVRTWFLLSTIFVACLRSWLAVGRGLAPSLPRWPRFGTHPAWRWLVWASACGDSGARSF